MEQSEIGSIKFYLNTYDSGEFKFKCDFYTLYSESQNRTGLI